MDEEAELRAHPNFYPLVDLIIDETYQRREVILSNLRLRYALAKDDEEKNNITKKLLKKTKKTLSNFYGQTNYSITFAIENKNYFDDDTAFISSEVHSIGYNNLTCKNLDQLNTSILRSIETLIGSGLPFLKPFADFINAITQVGLYKNLILLSDYVSKTELAIFENQKLTWHGNQTEFIELVKSLIENNNLRGIQKEIIENLSRYFGIQINHPDKLIQDIKKRNTGSETLFIDKLKSSLYDFISKENTR